MSGCPRNASASASTCQPGESLSDAAHNLDHGFQFGTSAIHSYYGSNRFFVIQWLAISPSSCPNFDVFLSHGLDSAAVPTDRISLIVSNISDLQPSWRKSTPGRERGFFCLCLFNFFVRKTKELELAQVLQSRRMCKEDF